MTINAQAIWQGLFLELTRLIGVAKDSADRAHEAATDKEAVAENKYDTRGLEASYLAHGQQERMAQCIEDNALFNELYQNRQLIDEITLGSLVSLESNEGVRHVLIGPSAGGIKVQWNEIEVLVITPQSPLGAQLLGKMVDDEVVLTIGDNIHHYDVVAID